MRLPTIIPAEYRGEDEKLPAYAWPGGYAIAYLTDDGEYLCAACVNDESNPVHEDEPDDGWRVIGYNTADWHDIGDPDWTCAHCSADIHAAVTE